jgi:hypothetical protein
MALGGYPCASEPILAFNFFDGDQRQNRDERQNHDERQTHDQRQTPFGNGRGGAG